MSDAVVAGLISAVVAIIVGVFTARQSRRGQEAAAKAAVDAQTVSSRTQIEELAFERAKGYLTDAMDRQAAEIRELEADKSRDHETIQRHETEIRTLHEEKREDRRKIADLKRRVETVETENADLRDRLGVATRLLEQKYPDEK